jgi:hypothetical protein
MKKEKEIFKIQIAIGGEPNILVYNKDRSNLGQFPISPEMEDFMNGKPKKYVYGSIRTDGKINIIAEAPAQSW